MSVRHLPWLIALFAPTLLSAQSSFSVDLGGSNINYTDGGTSTAASVSPFFTAYNPQGSLTGAANYSAFNTGGWSMQGALTASALSSASAPVRLEGIGMFTGTTSNTGTSSNSVSARGRLHFLSQTRGIWIGAGAGRSNDGEFSHDLLLGEFAGWAQAGPALFQIAVTPTRLRNEVDYTDAEATLSHFGGRTDLYASAGARMLKGGNTAWVSAGITYRIMSWLGIVASAGNYAPDYTQGIPGGRYISAAIRLSPHATSNSYISAAELDETPRAVERFSTFMVGPVTAADNLRDIKLRVTGASNVEVMGDFTDWQPLQMRNAGGDVWVASAKLPPGIFHMNVRADGGAWAVPAGMTSISDEFGGTVGLLVIDQAPK